MPLTKESLSDTGIYEFSGAPGPVGPTLRLGNKTCQPIRIPHLAKLSASARPACVESLAAMATLLPRPTADVPSSASEYVRCGAFPGPRLLPPTLRRTLYSRSACPADSMDKVLRHFGHIVVNDVATSSTCRPREAISVATSTWKRPS